MMPEDLLAELDDLAAGLRGSIEDGRDPTEIVGQAVDLAHWSLKIARQVAAASGVENGGTCHDDP